MKPNIDFTSSLYLGMHHSSASLEPWNELTCGVPAALRGAPRAAEVACELAGLVGCEAATLGVSTLHLFFDWCGTPAATRGTIMLWDRCVYPVAKWGIERARARGARSQSFTHLSTSSLARTLARATPRGLRPIVVTDGYCPGCGRSAPLAAYRQLAERAGGLVLVDDTQALGITGDAEHASYAGGGSLRRLRRGGQRVLWIASLAKAFGAPIAALAGDRATVERFERDSETRVHTSPPNAAAIAASARALSLNHGLGTARRARLLGRVRQFRAGLAAAGLSATQTLHPLQLLEPIDAVSPGELHSALARAGVQTVLVRPECRKQAAIAFLITATHDREQVDRALEVLVATVRRLRRDASPAGVEGEQLCRNETM